MSKSFCINRSWLRPLLALLILTGALAAAVSSHAAYNIWTSEYTLSKDELQTALTPQFPRKLRYMEVFEVTLSNPRLRMDESKNRLTTVVDALIENKLFGGAPVKGVLAMSSGLKYDAAARAIRLDAPAVENVDIAGMPSQYAQQLNAIGNVAADQILKNYAIYTFQPEQLELKGQRFEPGAITVERDGIKVEVKPL